LGGLENLQSLPGSAAALQQAVVALLRATFAAKLGLPRSFAANGFEELHGQELLERR
jgi:hypothetical protein